MPTLTVEGTPTNIDEFLKDGAIKPLVRHVEHKLSPPDVRTTVQFDDAGDAAAAIFPARKHGLKIIE